MACTLSILTITLALLPLLRIANSLPIEFESLSNANKGEPVRFAAGFGKFITSATNEKSAAAAGYSRENVPGGNGHAVTSARYFNNRQERSRWHQVAPGHKREDGHIWRRFARIRRDIGIHFSPDSGLANYRRLPKFKPVYERLPSLYPYRSQWSSLPKWHLNRPHTRWGYDRHVPFEPSIPGRRYQWSLDG